MNKNRIQCRGEQGWALVTAVSLMAVMLVIGLGTLATVDFNSGSTRIQRERESSLNLAEGLLSAQAFVLARQWPAPTKTAYPAKCSTAIATTGLAALQCPNKNNLSAANSTTPTVAAFKGTDFLKNGSWTTRVRDNYGALASAYSAAAADTNLSGSLGACNNPCSKDFNDDRALWVEARTVVRGQTRKVVALMRLELIQEGIPRTGITSGALALTNNGAGSYDASGAQAIVRCVPDYNLSNPDQECTNFQSSGQVNPPPVQGTVGNLMTADQIERFKDRAIIDGTYYPANYTGAGSPLIGCPPALAGAVVFIEYCKADGHDPGPTYTLGGTACTPPTGMSNSCTNTITKPGIVIVRCGGLRIRGGTFVGVLYFVNGSDGSCPGNGGAVRGTNPATCPRNAQHDETRVVLDVQDGGGIWGALAADGNACVQLGSNGAQFKFDPNVFSAVSSYGTVGLVQNTWRELPPGTS